ncbi:MAG: glycosyltransferase [Lachnospiraceae bacterium]|nr:glycosyltransferase [Lachnospiraceae bacterium]
MSIIMPVFNAEVFLDRSLRSVMDQSYRMLDIICVDDGSSDGSLKLLQKYAAEDKRISVIRTDNRGAGSARNLGFDAACGEYVLFFDADDILKKNMIRTLVKTSVKREADIVLFGYYKFSDDRRMRVPFSPKILNVPMNRAVSPSDISDVLFQADHGMPWNKFYRMDFLKSSGVRFQALKNTNDEFFSRITTVEAGSIVFLNKALIGYRVGNTNSLRGNANSNVLDCTYALKAIGEELKTRGKYDLYSDTFRKLAGYVIMLKLLAIDDHDAFCILADEISENVLNLCGMDESCFEDRYLAAYRALRAKDISKAEAEIDLIRRKEQRGKR